MSELCPLTYHTVIPVPVIISGVASRGPAGFQIRLHLIMMMLGLSALTSSRPVIYHCGRGETNLQRASRYLSDVSGRLKRQQQCCRFPIQVRTPRLKSGND